MAKFINPASLLQVYESYHIAIMDTAYNLERTYGSYMKPNPEGIYMIGSIDPVVPKGMRVYTNSGKQILTIEQFMQTNESIRNQDGRLLISAAMMARKSEVLFFGPTVPAQGLRMILTFSDYVISRRLQWIRSYAAQEQAILNLIEPGEEVLFTDGMLDAYCDKIVAQLDDIVIGSEWCHFNVRLMNCDLCVEKGVDHRIYEYHRMEYERLDGCLDRISQLL